MVDNNGRQRDKFWLAKETGLKCQVLGLLSEELRRKVSPKGHVYEGAGEDRYESYYVGRRTSEEDPL